VELQYEPTGQSMAALNPLEPQYVPAGQSKDALRPVVLQKSPAMQATCRRGNKIMEISTKLAKRIRTADVLFSTGQ
jgi:hypothetical protein